MKTRIYVFLTSFCLILSYNCSNSTTDEFNEANGSTASNLITKIASQSLQDVSENKTIIISYDANDRVSSVSDGTSAEVLVYNNGSLSNVSGVGDAFSIEELYNAPYDAFDTGSVEEYDNKGNPVKLTFYEREYNPSTGFMETVNYQADIFYDNTPNPYFYTLEAAGIIEVLDKVDLNFSLNPQIPQIVRAKMLFPLNNIKRIVYKDDKSVVLYEILADYVYNKDNYPISATVTGTSLSDNEVSIYTLNYTYKE
jgi:hypothetical protein